MNRNTKQLSIHVYEWLRYNIRIHNLPHGRPMMASFHFARHPIRTTVSFVKAACLVHLGITYGYTVSPAQGPSMLPTFTVDGDWILCDHTRRYGRGVSVGDLVVYRIPIFNNQWGVKRVTGMPGDYVSVGTPGEPGEELMIQVFISICHLTTY